MQQLWSFSFSSQAGHKSYIRLYIRRLRPLIEQRWQRSYPSLPEERMVHVVACLFIELLLPFSMLCIFPVLLFLALLVTPSRSNIRNLRHQVYCNMYISTIRHARSRYQTVITLFLQSHSVCSAPCQQTFLPDHWRIRTSRQPPNQRPATRPHFSKRPHIQCHLSSATL
jgi:hypothetical protein